MKRQNAALFFAGHFCADACTRLRKKGAARLPQQARGAGADSPTGGFERRGVIARPSFIILSAPFF